MQKAKKSQKRKLDEKVVDGVDEKSESVESKSLQAKFQKSSKKVEQHQQGPSVSKGPQPLAAKRDAQGERKPEFDAKKSNVYKSLFLSKEDKDKKSPWVTYNPYYAMSAPWRNQLAWLIEPEKNEWQYFLKPKSAWDTENTYCHVWGMVEPVGLAFEPDKTEWEYFARPK